MQRGSVQQSQSNSSMRAVDSRAVVITPGADPTAPKLQIKNHLLQDLNPDLRNHFLNTQIVQAGSSYLEKAFNLRLYARISKAHQQEVAHFMDQDENADIRLASTRWALPVLANFKLMESISRKKIFAQRVKDFADHEKYLHADLSANATRSSQISGLKKIALRTLLLSDTPQHIVIDISAKPIAYPNRHDWNADFKGEEIANTFRKDVIDDLNQELEKIVAAGRTLPEISLICRDHFLNWRTIRGMQKKIRLIGCLRVLDFSGSRFCYDKNNFVLASKNLVNSIACLILSGYSVKQLYLDRCAFYSQIASRLGEHLPKLKTLKVLSLSGNFIANELFTGQAEESGLIQILQAVNLNSSLTHLNLSDNNLGDRGAELVMNCLSENHVLQEVWLGGNQIDVAHPIWDDPRMQNRQ